MINIAMKKLVYFLPLFILVGCSLTSTSAIPTTSPHATLVGAPQGTPLANRRLQLDTFQIASPTPSASPPPYIPNDTCSADSAIPVSPNCQCPDYTVTCQGHYCAGVKDPQGLLPWQKNLFKCEQFGQKVCSNLGDGDYCMLKPVIYLYPTKPLAVDVTLTIPGTIVESDPLYGNGWFGVEVSPDGTLSFKARTYRELYYESSVHASIKPTTGIVIKAADLAPILTLLTGQFGLRPDEQREFLDFWVPKLQALNSPYILFSVIDPIEKDRTDHVTISPAPDTRIEFLAYFKPLKEPISVDPLILPMTMPQRIGFTEVEWGGTIDQSRPTDSVFGIISGVGLL